MYSNSRSPTLICVWLLVRVRWVLVVPRPQLLQVSIGAIDMLLGLERPDALLKGIPKVKVEVELEVLWLLLQPCVLLLLPSAAIEDKWIGAEDTHHFLHVLSSMCRTQRGTSGGGWGL